MNTTQLVMKAATALAVALATCGVLAQAPTPATGTTAKIIVTEEARQGSMQPVVPAKDVSVFQGHDRDQVTAWVPASGPNAGLELYILIDNDAASILASQLADIRNFIMEQPTSAKIGVAYMLYGSARVAQEPTSDHELAAKALRLPLSAGGINGSPYFALSSLVKHWPASHNRREVLMVSDGVDRYYEQADMFDPYLDKAIDDAQRAGVVVNVIYTPGVGTFHRSDWHTLWGQNYLLHTAQETGGASYYIGFNGPAVAFAPFLDDLTHRLNHQYLLSFVAAPEKKGSLEPIKVKTTESNTELIAAARVFVPANQ